MHVRPEMFRRIIAVVCVFFGSLALAVDVYIDTEVLGTYDDPESTVDAALLVVRDQLRSDLSSGVYDNHNIKMAIKYEGDPASMLPDQSLKIENDEHFLEITGSGFRRLSSRLQNQILDNLMEYYTESFVKSYKATVDVRNNRLVDVPFFRRMGIQISSLTEVAPAEQLLSRYASTWAYKTSLRSGPNCWHTAVASTNLAWSNHRYMNYSEFNCQLRTGYKKLDLTRDQLQYGDVISLVDTYGTPVHAFVYLGPDSQDTDKIIVFTKNGYRQGVFLFQDFDTVVNYVYPGNKLEYYRAVKHVLDPSDREQTACAREYGLDLENFLSERGLLHNGQLDADPIIVAGLKKFHPEFLPVLRP